MCQAQITQSSNNTIYHNNIINNTNQAYDNRNNYWGNGAEENYWSDYDSEGEGCFDANKDGICDSPYVIDSDSQDNYPFKQQNGWLRNIFYINLSLGWNLISIPLNLTNKTLSATFKSIEGNYSGVFTYNGKWIELKDNDKINETIGFWIKMNNSDSLTIKGDKFSHPINISLKEGWNLAGYPSLEAKNISELFNNVTVFAYNNSKWYSYDSDKSMNSLDEFTPGYGYWVK